jgi:trehalose-6-phosphatase
LPPSKNNSHEIRSASRRVFLLDHDGTLVAQSTISSRPSQEVLK